MIVANFAVAGLDGVGACCAACETGHLTGCDASVGRVVAIPMDVAVGATLDVQDAQVGDNVTDCWGGVGGWVGGWEGLRARKTHGQDGGDLDGEQHREWRRLRG